MSALGGDHVRNPLLIDGLDEVFSYAHRRGNVPKPIPFRTAKSVNLAVDLIGLPGGLSDPFCHSGNSLVGVVEETALVVG